MRWSSPAGPAGSGRRVWWELGALALVLGGGVWLRFHRLGALSVWLDEAITWERSVLPLPELFDDSVRRLHNPAYFAFMHYFLRLGDDEWMLRLPSAVLGALKLVAAAVLGHVAGGRRVAIGTVLLLGLSPAHLHYDQEARMYAFMTCATTVALAGLVWLLRHPQQACGPLGWGDGTVASAPAARRAWGAFVVGTTLALYAHNTAVFFVVSAGAVALLRGLSLAAGRLRFIAHWTAANLVVLLLWSPWIKYLLQQTRRIREHFWAKYPGPAEMRDVFGEMYLYDQRNLPVVAMALGLTALSVWALRRQRVLLASLLLLTLLTPALVLLVSLQRPIFLMRIMLWSSVPLCVLWAYGLSVLRPTWLYLACVGAIALGGLHALQTGYFAQRRKPEWREALTHIVDDWQDDSVIVLLGGREKRQVRYYFTRKTDPLPWRPYKNLGVEKRARRIAREVGDHRIVWAIYRGKRKPARIGRAYLDGHGKIAWRHHYGHSLHVLKYVMRPAS